MGKIDYPFSGTPWPNQVEQIDLLGFERWKFSPNRNYTIIKENYFSFILDYTYSDTFM